MSEYVIEMLNITKRFGNNIANNDITLRLKHGEIHALLGENGAGKSTLMSVLFGLYEPDGGSILKDGKPVKISDPNDASRLGIGMVHQHFKLVECFTVLDNIILGAEPTRFGFIDRRAARQKVDALIEKYGLSVDPDALVSDISVGMQQRVEILKMLYRDNDILIFDEPTAVLTPQETEELILIMKNFAREGKSILFITHKLGEILACADRCTVLRKGKFVGCVNICDTNKEELSKLMVGRNISFSTPKSECTPGETVLSVKDLTVASKKHGKNAVRRVSFDIHEGEIVCIAGIDGNGQSELISAITGLTSPVGGRIMLCGHDITHASVAKRSELKMSHIPEDRQKHGLVLDFTLEENLALQKYRDGDLSKCGFIRFSKRRDYSDRLIEKFDVRSGDGSVTIARSMSGGNQQKAIIAREVDRDHELLVAALPTRGLDVGAIEGIHHQLIDERKQKKAILLVSFELDEVMDISDRILVMYEGEITGEFTPKSTTNEELGLYMSGAKRQKAACDQASANDRP